MYGMVNQAIKEMVNDKVGTDFWQNVCTRLSLPNQDFDSFEQYDDDMTLNIVSTICELSEKAAPDVLIDFGRYWIGYAYRSEYKVLLETFSKSPITLIKSLNSLHDRLEMSFEGLKPPSFDIVDMAEGKIIVNYYSDRDMPLEYFVIGLFHGIFEHFGQTCEIDLIEKIEEAKATFQINYNEVQK
ncbi:MAG: heme NO-binding domain-containing protein [Bdellovibrionales bacterium]|nr:heme NO-binding domain-containing protein [Bdellovibrionales bacterium]NQZ17880.1 heme NO-binding domain-containing protein [Bdellovibrionales bacterium]